MESHNKPPGSHTSLAEAKSGHDLVGCVSISPCGSLWWGAQFSGTPPVSFCETKISHRIQFQPDSLGSGNLQKEIYYVSNQS